MLANDNDIPYYEISAKQEDGNEMYKLFEKAVSCMFDYLTTLFICAVYVGFKSY